MILLSLFRKNGALALLMFFLALPAQAAFTDNGDGTVSDTVTGLMWDQCSWGLSGVNCSTGAASQHTWAQALGVAVTANAANHKGHNDWRLPNKNELESLVDLTRSSPSIDTTAFPNTISNWYWSSTNYAPVPANAWYVYFNDGYSSYGANKTNTYYVRLVRSGQLLDSFDAQADTTPDPFSFSAQTGVALSTVATSNTITVSGINTASAISIVGGSYSINGGGYVSTAGTVNNGDTVTVQQTSSAAYSTLTTATLTIGGVSGAFDVTTLAADTIPDPFSFSAQTGVALSTAATSNTITVSGINAPSTISIVGGSYSINGGGYVSTAGTVNNGDTVTVQQTSSAAYSTTTTATLTIGGVSGAFDVTTLAAPAVATAYTAPSATGTGNISASFSGGGAGCGYTVSQFIPLTGNPASPPNAPPGVSFPHGLFDFITGGCTAGGTLNFTITYPQALPAGTKYWKYGPTPSDPGYHWYQLPATVSGNTVTFSITDGGLGDDDLTANGTIVDQGGPGVTGGGGAASIPTLSEWMLLALAGLMGLFGMAQARRRKAPGL